MLKLKIKKEKNYTICTTAKEINAIPHNGICLVCKQSISNIGDVIKRSGKSFETIYRQKDKINNSIYWGAFHEHNDNQYVLLHFPGLDVSKESIDFIRDFGKKLNLLDE